MNALYRNKTLIAECLAVVAFQILSYYFSIPLHYSLPAIFLIFANISFIDSLFSKKTENEKGSKLMLWLKTNLIALSLALITVGFFYLFTYGVDAIPDKILPILWIAAFLTVAAILLFRLNRLIKNRRTL